jgi:uncharacterized damage-inducible protein DinB
MRYSRASRIVSGLHLLHSTIRRTKKAISITFHAAKESFPMSTSPASTPYIEPWLRGNYADVPAVGRAVLHALDLALDDLAKWTQGLPDAEVHTQPLGLPSVAFHLRHIARSTDRLLSYAEGNQLTSEQLAALKAEQNGEESLAALLAEVEVSFSDAAARIRVLATANFDTFRGVGRKQLPTSIGGALIHVADHTQRHTGQVVTTAKVLKAMRT